MMDTNNIEVSVVIPTYNRANYISDAIRSVIHQKGDTKDFHVREIWVIDDGSTDRTEQVVKGISDSRVKYYRCKKNGGAGLARNIGVDMSSYEWIAFQDSDDFWIPEKLARQTECLHQFPDSDLIYCGFLAEFSDKKILCSGLQDQVTIRELCVRNFIGTPTMLVRKKAFLDVGGFDSGMKALEDWDFILRLAEAHKIAGIQEPLVQCDYTSEGLSSDVGKYFESRCYLIAKNKRILQKNQCFEQAVESLLESAKGNGVLNPVGNMLELYLRMQ